MLQTFLFYVCVCSLLGQGSQWEWGIVRLPNWRHSDVIWLRSAPVIQEFIGSRGHTGIWNIKVHLCWTNQGIELKHSNSPSSKAQKVLNSTLGVTWELGHDNNCQITKSDIVLDKFDLKFKQFDIKLFYDTVSSEVWKDQPMYKIVILKSGNGIKTQVMSQEATRKIWRFPVKSCHIISK